MKLLQLIAGLAVAACGLIVSPPAVAQPAGEGPPGGTGGRFRVFASAFVDSARTPMTRVTAEVPFSTLVFFKKQDVYHAEYDVYVEIWPRGKDVAHGTSYVLHGTAMVDKYEDTKKRDTRSRTWRVFPLDPGEYVVEATLRVKGTRLGMREETDLRVPDFLSSGIGFGTPHVLMVPTAQLRPFATWREFQNVPAVAKSADVTLAMFDRQPSVRFDLYLDEPTPQPINATLFYEVVSPRDHQVLYGRRSLRIGGNDDSFVIGFNVDDWNPGTYRLNMRVMSQDPARDASVSVNIKVDVTRVMLTTEFEQTMQIMAIVYKPNELKELQDADERERPVVWAKFWQQRDPDPDTPENEALQEYVSRVNHVMETYSRTGPGWRTDQGKTWIKYGRPDEIERAADQREQGRYEIWKYMELGLEFVFYDMFGVGDYKLVEGDMF